VYLSNEGNGTSVGNYVERKTETACKWPSELRASVGLEDTCRRLEALIHCMYRQQTSQLTTIQDSERRGAHAMRGSGEVMKDGGACPGGTEEWNEARAQEGNGTGGTFLQGGSSGAAGPAWRRQWRSSVTWLSGGRRLLDLGASPPRLGQSTAGPDMNAPTLEVAAGRAATREVENIFL
jgi:hypothetical protein